MINDVECLFDLTSFTGMDNIQSPSDPGNQLIGGNPFPAGKFKLFVAVFVSFLSFPMHNYISSKLS